MPKQKVKSKLKYCSFYNCMNSSDNIDIKFFGFPTNDPNCRKWVQACNNPKLKDLSTGYLSRSFHICDQHFEFLDYQRKVSPFKKFLQRGVIPKDIKSSLQSKNNGLNPPTDILEKMIEDVILSSNDHKEICLSENDVKDKNKPKNKNLPLEPKELSKLKKKSQCSEKNLSFSQCDSKLKKNLAEVQMVNIMKKNSSTNSGKRKLEVPIDKIESSKKLKLNTSSKNQEIEAAVLRTTLPNSKIEKKFTKLKLMNYIKMINRLKPLLGKFLTNLVTRKLITCINPKAKYTPYIRNAAQALYFKFRRSCYQFLCELLPLPNYITVEKWICELKFKPVYK